MKKVLLTLTTVMVGLSAAAATPFSIENRTKLITGGHPDMRSIEITTPVNTERPSVMSRAEAADEIFYSLAGDPYQALGFRDQKAGMQQAMAFQIEPTFLSNINDGEITSISFYTGVDNQTKTNLITDAWVFITDNLMGEYLYTQPVAEMPKTAFTQVNVPLDTPFAIPADTKIFVGVYFTLAGPNNLSLVVDNLAHDNDYGGWYADRANPDDAWTWDNLTSYYGFLTLGATIKGNMPKNRAALIDIACQPTVSENEPFSVGLLFQNNGGNDINNITVEFAIEGETPTTKDLTSEKPVSFNQMGIVYADFVATKPTKSTNLTITIKSINGEDNNAENKSTSYSISVIPEGKALQKHAVIEEFTGITCGYCPPGYTSMETIREEYPDGDIIPVCVHVNIPNNDPMTVPSFNNLVNNYCAGAPSAIVNRIYDVDPRDYNDLLETAKHVCLLPALGEVTAEAQLDRETAVLTVNTKTRFAFDYSDGNRNFILSYAITEDGVGPYLQTNYYSGQSGNVWGGWNKRPASVKLIYNDVARQLDKYNGITGSIPAQITAGETYEFSHDVKLDSYVEDPDKINLVVYLTNRKTGEIENACTIKNVGNSEISGIESVINDNNDAPVEYFNLQGLRINEPSNGIFIRRQGNKVSKVLVK